MHLKSSLPRAFWLALKVQLSVPVRSRSPLMGEEGGERERERERWINKQTRALDHFIFLQYATALTLPTGSWDSLVWMDQDGGVAPSHDLHVLNGHYRLDTMPIALTIWWLENVQLESVLTSGMSPAGVPIVGAISAKTSSNGLTKHNTTWTKKD